MSRRRSRTTGKAIPRGAGRDVTGQVAAMTQASGQGATRDLVSADGTPEMARLMPVPRGWWTLPFAPGRPLDPDSINPNRPDSGRPEPRRYEFPISWNLTNSADRFVPWAVLRAAADGISLFRRCIEIRKDHMLGLEWAVTISDRAIETAQRDADRAERKSGQGAVIADGSPIGTLANSAASTPPPAAPASDVTPGAPSAGGPAQIPGSGPQGQGTPVGGRAAAEDALRERLGPAIDAATKFLSQPDRGNGLKFGAWLGQLLEEVFVLDALAVYPRRTYGGDLWSLEVLDGSTIKPLLDERGGRPLPPFPAYQQILYGFPRGEFVAEVEDADGDDIPGAYKSDELLYYRRVARVWSPYGMSAVEQALEDGALYLSRHRWMRAEYTEGTSVDGLYETPETLNWSPEQLLEYEREFNSAFQGDTTARRGARFLPPGVKPAGNGIGGSDAIAERYKPDYDLHLIKLLASHFDTTLPELGFTESKGLGSEGYHEGQQNVQMRKRRPIIRFVEEIVTGMLHDQFGSPDEIVFKFLGLDDEDEPAAADVAGKRQATGVLTLNEMRDEIGRPRYEFPEADMPLLVTQRGIEVIEGAATRALAGQMETPEQAPPPGQPGGAPPAVPEGGQPGKPSPTANPTSSTPSGAPQAQPTAPTSAQKAAELVAYRRFTAKGARGRPFVWEHHTATEVAELTGVVRPKAAAPVTARQWPGWERDLQTAEVYASRLSRALTGAIGAATLAARWAEYGGGSDLAVARAWLEHQHYDLTGPLTAPIHSMWTEGWLIGDLSAGVLLAEHAERRKLAAPTTSIDWSAWKPGDPRAAAAILRGSGRYPGLLAMIESGDVTISSIAEHRLDELARVLSTAAAEGWGNGKTATALRGILDDPRWARMVAITEISRASSASSLSRYRDNGIAAKGWMSAMDQRVCPECHENEAQGEIPIADYFQDGTDAPPGHPTCLPGDALVSSRSRITGVTSRVYHGELVEIRTLGQKLLAGTPNHPVLTDHGWIPLGQLAEGQYVLSSGQRQGQAVGAQYGDDVPARIEDIAVAFLGSGEVATAEVPVSAEDFHGDGAGSEVAVIGTDGRLTRPVRQPSGEQIFQSGDVHAPTLKGAGRTDLPLHRDRYPSDGVVGSGGQAGTLVGRCARHALDHGGRSSARLYAGIQQDAPDGITGDGVELGQRLLADAGDVALDQVVFVRRYPFSGHVYNLQTEDGWYIGNGIIVHNCRCAVYPGSLTSADLGSGGPNADLLSDLGAVGLSDEEAGLLATGEDGEAVEIEGGVEFDGGEVLAEWDSEAAELDQLIEEESLATARGRPMGGSMGDVWRVETSDGRFVIRKTVKDPYRGADESENAMHQRDADILHAQVARALDLESPAIAYRDNTMYMSMMDGRIAAEAGAYDQGDVVRLLDILIDNSDRNEGNWLVGVDGHVQVIDGGLAFQNWGLVESVPRWQLRMLEGFTDRLGENWTTNPFTRSFYDNLAERLTSLKARFELLGRESWYERMMGRLDVLRGHAEDA